VELFIAGLEMRPCSSVRFFGEFVNIRVIQWICWLFYFCFFSLQYVDWNKMGYDIVILLERSRFFQWQLPISVLYASVLAVVVGLDFLVLSLICIFRNYTHECISLSVASSCRLIWKSVYMDRYFVMHHRVAALFELVAIWCSERAKTQACLKLPWSNNCSLLTAIFSGLRSSMKLSECV